MKKRGRFEKGIPKLIEIEAPEAINKTRGKITKVVPKATIVKTFTTAKSTPTKSATLQPAAQLFAPVALKPVALKFCAVS